VGSGNRRLRGCLTPAADDAEQEEAETASSEPWTRRHQQAKSLELRAAMKPRTSVAAAGQKPGANQLAGGDLRLVHRGFDTADLQEARALLTVLC